MSSRRSQTALTLVKPVITTRMAPPRQFVRSAGDHGAGTPGGPTPGRVPGRHARLRYEQSLPTGRRLYLRRIKPVIDRLLAAVLLVLSLPVTIPAGIAVLVALGRPVILKQDRVGLDGRTFTIWKFRTMRTSRREAHDRRRTTLAELLHPDRRAAHRRRTHKHPHDPRLVPVGRFLRRWSLDELPQVVNVIRGDMSLVGPRPELSSLVEQYQAWQHERHVVKPGITGLWQVSDRGGDGVLMHERTDIDLHYVRGVSWWLDLKLLVLTVPAALGFRRGS